MPDRFNGWPQGSALLTPPQWGDDMRSDRLREGDDILSPPAIAARSWAGTPMESTGLMWTSRGYEALLSFSSVCWSPELRLFVAVGSGPGNRTIFSSDGISWQPGSITNGIWNSVCWSRELGLFVTVGSALTGRRAATSSDGITWTLRTTAADLTWFSVCWSPELGLFAAVASTGGGNRVMTSPDGETWTAQSSASNSAWRSITWSPELGMFVACATQVPSIMYSYDGINWSNGNSNIPQLFSICWAAELGLFVVVQGGGSRGVVISEDGINFRQRPNVLPQNSTINNICWSPDLRLFVTSSASAAESRHYVSSDAVRWQFVPASHGNPTTSVCWSPQLGMFVVVGNSGTNSRIMTSGGL
jgi:hypothetical protein